MFGSWIVDHGPPVTSCKVLVDPRSDRICGNPADSGHTALDMPLCDDCWIGVQTLAG